MLRVAVKLAEKILLLVALVALERFDDGLGGEPFVDEQRQRGHVEREPLRLARPAEEGLRERLQAAEGFLGFWQVISNQRVSNQFAERWVRRPFEQRREFGADH